MTFVAGQPLQGQSDSRSDQDGALRQEVYSSLADAVRVKFPVCTQALRVSMRNLRTAELV